MKGEIRPLLHRFGTVNEQNTFCSRSEKRKTCNLLRNLQRRNCEFVDSDVRGRNSSICSKQLMIQ